MEKPPEENGQDIWDTCVDWWCITFASDNDQEYVEQILPACIAHVEGAQFMLDVGCGEGQILRRAQASGVKFTVGIDQSFQMVKRAVARCHSNTIVVQGDASALPFADESFDVATVVLALEHVSDMPSVMSEIARVLCRTGRLLVVLNHPFTQSPGSGWVDDHIIDDQYWAVSRYLGEEVSVEAVDAEVSIPFAHRPLMAYLNAASKAGLSLVQTVEPAPPAGYFGDVPTMQAAYEIPRLIFLTWEKQS